MHATVNQPYPLIRSKRSDLDLNKSIRETSRLHEPSTTKQPPESYCPSLLLMRLAMNKPSLNSHRDFLLPQPANYHQRPPDKDKDVYRGIGLALDPQGVDRPVQRWREGMPLDRDGKLTLALSDGYFRFLVIAKINCVYNCIGSAFNVRGAME
ncbi:hypothetical protein RchiOBHm_Chr4g0422761 [Rosa chinensis]|uniref:Uncharacterized protein n=1 Tax=Rosa chinensis TaxID=74649 RepID=A0A2P6QYG0_ROSCH|nr:hypothetical protein RchiOBHm_Chr4g0422761 [Rosa chinensis]